MNRTIMSLAVGGSLLLTLGCSSGSNSGGTAGGGNFFIPQVDLAIGDDNANFENLSAFPPSQILLYLNVLNDTAGNSQDPDIVLDDTTGLDKPREMLFSDGDLYVGDTDGGQVLIWRDYQSLSDNATPDATITTAIASARDVAVGNDLLIVADDSNNEIYSWSGAATLTGDPAADLTLATNLTSVDHFDYDAEGDRLFVAQWTSTGAEGCAVMYDDMTALTTAGVDVAPDAELTVDGSFLGIGDCRSILVNTVNDTLYVATGDYDSSGEFQALWVFDGASTLTTDQLPAAVIAFTGVGPYNVLDMAYNNGRLYIGNRNGPDDDCNSSPAVLGYTLEEDGTFLPGQTPSFQLDQDSLLVSTQSIEIASGFLFANSMNPCYYAEGSAEVRVYAPDSLNLQPLSGSQPWLTIPALKDFTAAVSIAVAFSDQST